MDPDTANPRLTLHAGNTRLYTQAYSQDVPDLPGRFDVALACLGSTGFSSGRQFWEVNVAHLRCYHIGIASASAKRKGILKFSPATGYWTMIKTKANFKALDTAPTVIPVTVQPVTVGIFLDYEKGRISFYDSGAQSHFYSFSGHTFTDALYPFINFCDADLQHESPINLIRPGSTNWIQ